MFMLALEYDIDLLCPSGHLKGGDHRKKARKGPFPKDLFLFDEQRDRYVCPAGNELQRCKSGRQYDMRYVQYRCHDCLDCPLRERCTKSQSGRTIKRYESDELSDAMKQVLDQARRPRRDRVVSGSQPKRRRGAAR